MSIPDEAVEAAVKKLSYLNSDAGDQLTDEEWARQILEAAAPFMVADDPRIGAMASWCCRTQKYGSYDEAQDDVMAILRSSSE